MYALHVTSKYMQLDTIYYQFLLLCNVFYYVPNEKCWWLLICFGNLAFDSSPDSPYSHIDGNNIILP